MFANTSLKDLRDWQLSLAIISGFTLQPVVQCVSVANWGRAAWLAVPLIIAAAALLGVSKIVREREHGSSPQHTA